MLTKNISEWENEMSNNLISLMRDKFDSSPKSNPNNAESLLKKGLFFEFSGKLEEAVDIYNQITESNPNHEIALRKKIDCLLWLKRYREAIQSIDRVIMLSNNFYSWKQKVLCLIRLKNINEAIKVLDFCFQWNPIDEMLWNFKGDCLLAQNEYKNAIKFYDSAIVINPSFELSYRSKGFCLLKLGNYRDSNTSLLSAHELHRQSIPNRMAISKRKFYLDDYKDYILTEISKLDPKNSFNWELKGDANAYFYNYQEAINNYEKSLEIGSEFGDIFFKKGFCYLKLKQYETAIESFDHSIKWDPKSADGWVCKAFCLNNLQKYEEALKVLDMAQEKDPSDSMVWENKANSLVGLQKYQDAIDHCDKGLELENDNVHCMLIKSRCLMILENYQLALIPLVNAIHQNIENIYLKWLSEFCEEKRWIDFREDNEHKLIAQGWSEVGFCQQNLSNFYEAIKAYDRALFVDPNHKFSTINREKCLDFLEPLL